MVEDAQLLRQFIEGGSEAAFAELVHRHLALVYHAAVRQLGDDAHLASDVTQGVFILLAQKSGSLLEHRSVAGWLHTTTHFKVSEVRRSERRRRHREEAAYVMGNLMKDAFAAAEWDRMRPVIDEVLLELGAADREAVLLRFFENRPFAEIGERLRLTEKSAHKRVERALDKLRDRLARRGVTSTAAALAMLLSGQASLAVPAGLGGSVTGAVVTSVLPMAATLGALSFMSMKTTVAMSVMALVLAGGVLTYQVSATRAEAAVLAAAMQENETLAARVRTAEEADRVRKSEVMTVPKLATPSKAVSVFVGPTEEQKMEEGRAFLEANPELRAAFAAKLRASILVEYADLIASIGLAGDRLEQFVSAQMRARVSIVGRHIFTLANGALNTEQLGQDLREALGEAGYQQYIDFNRFGPVRSLAEDLIRSLYFTSTPLPSTQIEQIKQLVAQVISDPANGPRYTGPSRNLPLPVWDALLLRAPGVLAEPQIEAVRELRQQSKFYIALGEARKIYDQGPTN